ncbi:MAG: divergent polysaccharide deacetylase family protein [Xanthomonadaceae bacterium]|nr:divergent polysaccharide deacetylase family protein [Xanthomonadaceae bacterium]
MQHAAALVLAAVLGAVAPRIALIIDDLGDRPIEGERAVLLPGPIAMAFLPHTPHARRLAERAHASGKEVMLHLPLQAVNGDELGPGAIMLDTQEGEFRARFTESLASVPHVAGINTHMGSLLTRHPGHMQWLMSAIGETGPLFFVDSYTAAESIALAFALEAGIPAARRDVFLDPDPTPAAIEYQFARLVRLAHARGSAIGIGHPYPATLEVLERELPRLAEYGVELVSVSQVIAAQASPQRGVNQRDQANSAHHPAEGHPPAGQQ